MAQFDDWYLQDIADAINKMSDYGDPLNHQIESLNSHFSNSDYNKFQLIAILNSSEFVLLEFDSGHDAGVGDSFVWVKSVSDNKLTSRTVGTKGSFNSWGDGLCIGRVWEVMDIPDEKKFQTLEQYNDNW